MRRVTTNFILDTLLLVVLMSQVFAGILLHRFPPELANTTVLSLTRYAWGTVHWSASILFALVVVTHFLLHWGWVKATTLRYVRMRSRVLLISVIMVFLFVLLTPYYVTRDFRDREDIKNYTQTPYQEVVIQDGVTCPPRTSPVVVLDWLEPDECLALLNCLDRQHARPRTQDHDHAHLMFRVEFDSPGKGWAQEPGLPRLALA
jgi:hypothetical protein